LRQQYKAERLAEHIEATVAAWPPLTDEQRHTLALLRAQVAMPHE